MILTRILFTALLILGVISALGAFGAKEQESSGRFAAMSAAYFIMLTFIALVNA